MVNMKSYPGRKRIMFDPSLVQLRLRSSLGGTTCPACYGHHRRIVYAINSNLRVPRPLPVGVSRPVSL